MMGNIAPYNAPTLTLPLKGGAKPVPMVLPSRHSGRLSRDPPPLALTLFQEIPVLLYAHRDDADGGRSRNLRFFMGRPAGAARPRPAFYADRWSWWCIET